MPMYGIIKSYRYDSHFSLYPKVPIVKYEGGTYITIRFMTFRYGIHKKIGYSWEGPFEVYVDSDTPIIREKYRRALGVAKLNETYDDIDFWKENEIPIPVALDGSPAIATYLYAVQKRSKSEIAEMMSVTDNTVTKYFNRFDPPLSNVLFPDRSPPSVPPDADNNQPY